LDGLFSYIGGLFGFAVTFLFIMTFYTDASYEIEMGDKLFYYDQADPLDSGDFNFLYFIGLIFFYLFKMINIELPWKKMKKFHDCKEEVD